MDWIRCAFDRYALKQSKIKQSKANPNNSDEFISSANMDCAYGRFVLIETVILCHFNRTCRWDLHFPFWKEILGWHSSLCCHSSKTRITNYELRNKKRIPYGNRDNCSVLNNCIINACEMKQSESQDSTHTRIHKHTHTHMADEMLVKLLVDCRTLWYGTIWTVVCIARRGGRQRFKQGSVICVTIHSIKFIIGFV